MSTRNELKFMVIRVTEGKEDRSDVEHDEFGNAIRPVFTIRDMDEDEIESLRASIYRIRELYNPPEQ
jgi:hypothetical protein